MSLPKIIRLCVTLVILHSCVNVMQSQATFTLTSPLCIGNTVTASGTSGTVTASGYTWNSSPTGPAFSTPNNSATDITFSQPGTYTIQLAVSSGTANSTHTQIVTVNPLPTLTLSSTAASICAGQDATLTASGAANYTWNPIANLYFFSNSSAYVSPNVTSSYSITGTNSVGCIGSAAFTVNVYTNPSLNMTAGSLSVCPGFSTTINATGAASYTWTGVTFTGSSIQASIAAGVGSYTLIGANGVCNDTSVIVIGVAPSLSLALSVSRTTICANDGDSLVAVNVSASGATNFTWTPFDPARMSYSLGATTAVSPSVTTCYTLTGSTPACKGAVPFCVNVSTCTAIKEIEQSNEVSVFPNPVQNKLFIRLNYPTHFTIKLVTIDGKIVLEDEQERAGALTEEVSMEAYPAGIYFLNIYSAGEPVKIIRVLRQ